jgi:hypothetical protein
MDKELRKEELQRMIDQLPPGALPQTEESLRKQIDELNREQEESSVASYEAGWEFPAKVATHAPAKSHTIPLTIMIGNEKRIVGTAEVAGEEVLCRIDDDPSGQQLIRMITDGVVDHLSVSCRIAPPAQPMLPVEYGKPFTGKLPRIEGLSPDHTLVDEEPWKDKFPYGPM